MARIIRRTLPAALVAALALSISGPGAALGRILPGGSIGGKFPSPPAIQENVKFWRDIFARYKITEVVYHDEVHLDRRYAVLRLAGPWKGTQAQKKRIRAYKEKIRAVLRALAEDRTPPAGPLSARIRKIFSDRPRAELWDALYQIRAQPGLRERFREGYIRSGRYLAHFRRIFRKRGLPEDLILLPHVESGFRSQIYSHAGALGLWQFIRSTARLFVRVDGTIDARRDPFLAAEAAARGAKVLCVSTVPQHAPETSAVEVIAVDTAAEMASAVGRLAPGADYVFMAAAVAATPTVKSV